MEKSLRNTKLFEPEGESSVIDRVIEDCFKIPIILNSEAGHGKSTSLKTIIAKLKKKHPKTIVKVFDISQSWFHIAPLGYRQRITTDVLPGGFERLNPNFLNLDDCIYEIGSLSKDFRRVFVAFIIKQDYDIRYEIGLKYGPRAVGEMPRIIYVFEEANCYFDSYSLRKSDVWSPVLNDFISVGRNYGMRGFLVVTAEQGELSPSFRRRATGRLLGRIVNEYDLTYICKGRTHMKDVFRKMPPYHWIYYHGDFSEAFRIRDTVGSTPDIYVLPQAEVAEEVREPWGTWRIVAATAIATFIACLILFRL